MVQYRLRCTSIFIGKRPTYLAKTIAAALEYKNNEDKEAVELQQMISASGYKKTLEKVSNLPADHPLIPIILEEIEEIKIFKNREQIKKA